MVDTTVGRRLVEDPHGENQPPLWVPPHHIADVTPIPAETQYTFKEEAM